MIDLNFGLWWSGSNLSYLRYLTFKTLRHFHPHSRIQLFMPFEYRKGKGLDTCQEFKNPSSIKEDYIGRLHNEFGVEIITVNKFGSYAPNFQSDLFRWWFLQEHGGFYLDTDQIVLRSFKGLPLADYEIIYSSYKVKSAYAPDGKFSPVGIIGATTESKTVKHIANKITAFYNADDYNSIGPWMFAKIVEKGGVKNGFNAPSEYFYPAPICDYTNRIYDGSLEITKDNYSLHWYGGYKLSQKFNVNYSEEIAKNSDDTISKFLRENNLL